MNNNDVVCVILDANSQLTGVQVFSGKVLFSKIAGRPVDLSSVYLHNGRHKHSRISINAQQSPHKGYVVL